MVRIHMLTTFPNEVWLDTSYKVARPHGPDILGEQVSLVESLDLDRDWPDRTDPQHAISDRPWES